MLFLTGPCQILNIYFSHPLSFLFLLGLSVCPFVSLPYCLSVCLSVNLLMESKNMIVFNSKYYFRRSAHYLKKTFFWACFVCLHGCLPAYLPVCLSLTSFTSVCMSVCMPVSPYVCLAKSRPFQSSLALSSLAQSSLTHSSLTQSS
jgi:hypothetical protein